MTPATTSATSDDTGNLDLTAADQMSDAAAHATITLAQTKRLFPSTATGAATAWARVHPAATSNSRCRLALRSHGARPQPEARLRSISSMR